MMTAIPTQSTSDSSRDERDRLLALLQLYGASTTSFQTLEAGFRYWFDDADACVAFVETRGAWVVAGAPICPTARLAAVTSGFAGAARAAGRRVAYFAVEQSLVDCTSLSHMYIGEQPVWDATRWPETVTHTRRLREQLRRAENKGVIVRGVASGELAPGSLLRAAIELLIARWRRDKPMAPMGFLVDVQPFEFPSERRYFVAERAGVVVGFLAAVPIYRRRGWLIEDFLRDPSAPNGTAELLIDAAMRALGDEGSHYVTLGLAPLSGPVRGWLRAARRLSSTLYDFAGLRAFKAKLRPHAWEPIYLAHAPGSSSHLALVDALAAFARGSFLRFGGATLLRGPALVVRVLAALLVPWTLMLLLTDSHWFPAQWVKTAWIGFDLALVGALFSLTRRWRHWLGVAVATTVSADALLTTTQFVGYDLARVRGGEWLIVAIALAGPSLAAAVLWGAVGHRRAAH